MDKKSKNTLIVSIIALALVLIGVTYAYFSARITGLESASTLSLTAGRMGIVYSEGDENVSVNNIYPREEAWLTKTITLTGYNTTEQVMRYDLGLNVIVNTFTDNYLTYNLTMLNSTNGVPISSVTNVPISGTGFIKFGTGRFVRTDGGVHQYELKIYFKDNGLDQNDAQEAVFNAKVYVGEYSAVNTVVPIVEKTLASFDIDQARCAEVLTSWDSYTASEISTFCSGGTIVGDGWTWQAGDGSADNELIQDGVLTNLVYDETPLPEIPNNYSFDRGIYRYTYISSNDCMWCEGNLPDYELGWQVSLIDLSSTAPITEAPLVMINNEPVVSMRNLFSNSHTTSIDLSGFDTANVKDMRNMFYGITLDSLDLSYLDTASVTDMRDMFRYSDISSVDFTALDFSSVETINGMFSRSKMSSISLTGKDFTRIKDFNHLFSNSSVEYIDLSNCNFSNLDSFDYVFYDSRGNGSYWISSDALTLARNASHLKQVILRGVDFSNVESMTAAFSYSNIELVDFTDAILPKLTDISSLMSYNVSSFISIRGLDTSRVTKMDNLFMGSSDVTELDLSTFDSSSLNSCWNMFKNCSNLTTIYATEDFDLSNLSSAPVFEGCYRLVGGQGTNYRTDRVHNSLGRIDGGTSRMGFFTDINDKPTG